IRVAGHQTRGSRARGQVETRTAVRDDTKFRAGVWVPEAQRAVSAPHDQGAAAGVPRHGEWIAGRAAELPVGRSEGAEQRAAGIPDPHGAVGRVRADCSQSAPVRAPRDAAYRHLLGGEAQRWLLTAEVPDLQTRLLTIARQQTAVGGPFGQRLPSVCADYQAVLRPGGVEDAHLALVGRGDLPAVEPPPDEGPAGSAADRERLVTTGGVPDPQQGARVLRRRSSQPSAVRAPQGPVAPDRYADQLFTFRYVPHGPGPAFDIDRHQAAVGRRP